MLVNSTVERYLCGFSDVQTGVSILSSLCKRDAVLYALRGLKMSTEQFYDAINCCYLN